MKRIGNIYQNIISLENLAMADTIARKGKGFQYGIKIFDRNKDWNLTSLHNDLKNLNYKTSPYTTFTIREPKERVVFRLPYFPDRIVHHAIMIQLENMFRATFTADTYSCIKGRGIHPATNAVRKALKDVPGTTYCLKLDVKKFYPSIDHRILKGLLMRKIKDINLLWLLFEIIDSTSGIPIGNYLSQYFANFYLSYFDHWIKEVLKVKYFFRYSDDMVFLSGSKEYLHKLLSQIRDYLTDNLNLTIKGNYQIFPVEHRGIDFVGYKTFHFYTLLRKSTKQNFARMIANNKNQESIASYNGWAKHCDSKHLMKKLLA